MLAKFLSSADGSGQDMSFGPGWTRLESRTALLSTECGRRTVASNGGGEAPASEGS